MNQSQRIMLRDLIRHGGTPWEIADRILEFGFYLCWKRERIMDLETHELSERIIDIEGDKCNDST